MDVGDTAGLETCATHGQHARKDAHFLRDDETKAFLRRLPRFPESTLPTIKGIVLFSAGIVQGAWLPLA
jgi:hypothetical protein